MAWPMRWPGVLPQGAGVLPAVDINKLAISRPRTIQRDGPIRRSRGSRPQVKAISSLVTEAGANVQVNRAPETAAGGLPGTMAWGWSKSLWA